MYPKAYLFHDNPCDGIGDLFSSPMLLTFGSSQLNMNSKAHKDIVCMPELYRASGHLVYPRFITTVYSFDKGELLATILKFGLQHYCYLKSDDHFSLAKSLVKVHKKLEGTMQNMSDLESSLRPCYQSLRSLQLEGTSPFGLSEIDDMSHILSFRKIARSKLTHLIQSEFIDNIC